MSEKHYSNGDITVVWKPDLCIHSERCVNGLGEVFNPKARPWIDVQAADSEAIIKQVRQCPSGALSILEHETSNNMEDQHQPLAVQVFPNGPVRVPGPCEVVLADGTKEVKDKDIFLCRCGHSSNKPYCDGSHKAEGFEG